MTAGNFLRGSVIAVSLVPLAPLLFPLVLEPAGLVLALVSGALTSGLGYALWYRVLPELGTARASVVQLAVPVLAGLAGVVVLDEVVTLRLAVASVVILGGVALAVIRRGGPSRVRLSRALRP